MPRVHRVTTRASKKTRRCTGCSEPILAGQDVYTYSRRFGRTGMTYWRHAEHGYPRPTELSSAKTAQIVEAISEAEALISAWTPELPADAKPEDQIDLDISDLETALSNVGSCAQEVGQEYADGVMNMPEGLQQGPTGEAMQTVADELEDWGSNLESWSPSEPTEIVLPSDDDVDAEEEQEDGSDEWRARAEEAWDAAVDALRSEAEGELEGMPEYQG